LAIGNDVRLKPGAVKLDRFKLFLSVFAVHPMQ
jgi:hypothetical protein